MKSIHGVVCALSLAAAAVIPAVASADLPPPRSVHSGALQIAHLGEQLGATIADDPAGGVRIKRINDRRGAAAAHGLHAGDTIIAANEASVDTLSRLADILVHAKREFGGAINLTVREASKGDSVSFTVTLP